MRDIKKLNLEQMKFDVRYFSCFDFIEDFSLDFEERQREENENEYVEEMGEDEYDALPDEEKQRIDQKRLQLKKDRILKYKHTFVFISLFILFRFL
jgi:hypothetical protein